MEAEQRLLAEVMTLFARVFDRHAILRGGMVLRVLGSARLTNDLDYVFVPYKSKKDIVEKILNCLSTLDGLELYHSLNSKYLRIMLSRGGVTVQIEAKVAKEVKTEVTSTKIIADEFEMPPHLICVMDYSLALAHKMAAWNERRLMRDVYDMWFYITMGVKPDSETLMARLKKPEYSKLILNEDYFFGSTETDFFEFILSWLQMKSDVDVRDELQAYLPLEELPGLLMKFKAAITRLL